MNVNYLLIPTLILSILLFFLSQHFWFKLSKSPSKYLFLFIGMLTSIPGVLFVIYYFHWFDNAVWFYAYRSYPFTELTAAGAGIPAGIIAAIFKRYKLFSSSFILCILALGIFIPHSKSILFPVDYSGLEDTWVNDFCLQSCNSTCGPASCATILKHLGIPVTEKELAEECYSYIGGTEIWYIARALQKRNVDCEFIIQQDELALPWPCIAGIHIGAGHFITIIDKQEGEYILGDPLVGERKVPEDQIFQEINFTGFFLVISN